MKMLEGVSDENNKTINGMSEEEAKKYVLWDFERLHKYLLETVNNIKNHSNVIRKKSRIHIGLIIT